MRLAAAFTWAIDKKKDFVDAVRWGVAAGTASAKLPGVTFANLDQTKQMYPHVEVRSIGRPLVEKRTAAENSG